MNENSSNLGNLDALLQDLVQRLLAPAHHPRPLLLVFSPLIGGALSAVITVLVLVLVVREASIGTQVDFSN